VSTSKLPAMGRKRILNWADVSDSDDD